MTALPRMAELSFFTSTGYSIIKKLLNLQNAPQKRCFHNQNTRNICFFNNLSVSLQPLLETSCDGELSRIINLNLE